MGMLGKKKVNYEMGDDLVLYDTPEEAFEKSKRRMEEEELRNYMLQNMKEQKQKMKELQKKTHEQNITPNSSANSSLNNLRIQTPPQNVHYSQFNGSSHSFESKGGHHSSLSSNSTPQHRGRVPPPPIPTSNQGNANPPYLAFNQSTTTSPQRSQNTNPDNSPKKLSQQDMKDIKTATQLFIQHDTKKRGQLSSDDLQKILQNDDKTAFCESATETLIDMFGVTRFGTVNKDEFIAMYRKIKYWRRIYVDNDINGSQTLSNKEYHNSILELGYILPIETTMKLFERYARFLDPSSNERALRFDRFIESLSWLVRLTKVFKKYDPNAEGIATIHYKDFIDSTLYLGKCLPH